MTDWICPNCEWWLDVDPVKTPPLFCHECGNRTKPHCEPESVKDKDTKTDKLC